MHRKEKQNKYLWKEVQQELLWMCRWKFSEILHSLRLPFLPFQDNFSDFFKNRHVKLFQVFFYHLQWVCVFQAAQKNLAVHKKEWKTEITNVTWKDIYRVDRHMILNKLHQISPHFKLSSLTLTCDTYSQHSPIFFFIWGFLQEPNICSDGLRGFSFSFLFSPLDYWRFWQSKSAQEWSVNYSKNQWTEIELFKLTS